MPLPKLDQIELTLLGPGFGESSVVHVGSGHWIVIDSCIHSDSGIPAALHYLRENGVDPAQSVRLIIASHWHDDHIRGMARLVRDCPNAKFCCSSALSAAEFLATIIPYAERHMITGGSGVSEIVEVLEEFSKARGTRAVTRALANTRVLQLPGTALAHGLTCEIWTLSPSHGQFKKFLGEIAKLVPVIGQTKFRAPDQSPNHLAVVTWIQIGDTSMLLGSDLEETSDADTGWSVIVASAERPGGQAIIFKVPHHGSQTAHNADVWSKMLRPSPFAVLTPFNRGTKLPTSADVKRILSYTHNAYISAQALPQRPRRAIAVEKEIRASGTKLQPAEPQTGAVRLRNGGLENPSTWSVELFAGACSLTSL